MAELKEARVPDIGGSEGVPVIELLVKVGDTVAKDQGLVTLESDKATMEVPSPFAGVVRELKVKIGDEIGTGALVAMIEAGEGAAATPAATAAPAVAAPAAAAAPAPTVPKAEPAPASKPQPAAPTPPAPPTAAHAPAESLGEVGSLPYASPAVRVFARELGVDLARVRGSERGGRIVKADVQAFVKSALAGGGGAAAGGGGGGGLQLIPWPQVDFAKFGEVERQPRTRINKLSAANLARNWAMIPHVTQFDDADITEMEAFRKKLGEENKDVKVTPLVFLIRPWSRAEEVPALQRLAGRRRAGAEEVLPRRHRGRHARRLVVPVIRDADRKGLLELSHELAELSAKAREKKLSPADMQGGCFSISSLGGIGGTAFTPIINAPEVAILGVSRSATRPVWNGSEFAPRLMLPLSLSYDHRVIDGAAAARFTAYLGQVLGDLRRLLL
jgi:pyruvate dehydrogenase E2 component (dihydrolipoamide acetyltransferase)